MIAFDTLSEVELCEKISRLEHENRVLRREFARVSDAIPLGQTALCVAVQEATKAVLELNTEIASRHTNALGIATTEFRLKCENGLEVK